MYNTGARVSEITGLRVRDVLIEREVAVCLHGKGRKERVIPLWKTTASELRSWLRDRTDPDAPVFSNRAGSPLTRSGVRDRLDCALVKAVLNCPSLKDRRVSPHILRHSCAMHLLQSGVDITVIAMWLGHSDPGTTHHYLEVDLATKEAALQLLSAPETLTTRYQPGDRLLAFLTGL